MKIISSLKGVILLFILMACTGHKQNNNKFPVIDVAADLNKTQQVNLSRFADNITYIKLGELSEITLADSPPFDISDNLFVTIDRDYSLAILDKSMSPIARFGKRGRGPEEYTTINNLCFGKDKKVYFNSMADLFEYNPDDSLLMRYTGLLRAGNEFYMNQWSFVADSLIFGYIQNNSGSEKFKAALIGFEGNVIRYYKNHELLENQGTRVISGLSQIRRFGGSVYFKEQFNDTIYSLDRGYNLIPEYLVNLGEYKTPSLIRANFYKYFETINEYISIDDFYRTGDYVLLKINLGNRFPAKRLNALQPEGPAGVTSGNNSREWYNTTSCLGIFNVTNNELLICKPESTDNPLATSGLYNDIDAGPWFFPRKQVNDSTLVMLVTARSLKAHVASNEFRNCKPLYSEKKKQLEDFANSLSEFDNPVLMIVTIK